MEQNTECKVPDAAVLFLKEYMFDQAAKLILQHNKKALNKIIHWNQAVMAMSQWLRADNAQTPATEDSDGKPLLVKGVEMPLDLIEGFEMPVYAERLLQHGFFSEAAFALVEHFCLSLTSAKYAIKLWLCDPKKVEECNVDPPWSNWPPYRYKDAFDDGEVDGEAAYKSQKPYQNPFLHDSANNLDIVLIRAFDAGWWRAWNRAKEIAKS